MSSAVITVRTEPEVKEKAQMLAQEMGMSLSDLLNKYLKQFVKTKTKDYGEEEPSPYLIRLMKKAEKDRKAGKASPIFNSADEMIAWLEKHGI